MRIFDCSNSGERPPHRSMSFGPRQNDVRRSLSRYSIEFGVEYVNDPAIADVIITNDVFPSDILKLDKKKVKRMDGIYWDDASIERNIPLNRAASQADLVIFVSKYSQDSYRQLYGDLKTRNVVVLNQVDGCMFNKNAKSYKREDKFVWTASASNWERKEKRFDALMSFAKIIDENSILQLIGHCNVDVPKNVVKLGYKNDEMEVAEILIDSHAFVNFSYRDAAPKVVCQALNCGLPVLFADSGGTGELVENFGVGVKDEKNIVFQKGTIELQFDEIKKSYDCFMKSYNKMAESVKKERHGDELFKGMIEQYFNYCESI